MHTCGITFDLSISIERGVIMKFPTCQCGCSKWDSANGQLSAAFSQCSYWCAECGREGVYIRCKKSIVLIVFITTEAIRDVDQEYIQNTLFPHWEALDRRSATPTATAPTEDCIAPNIPNGQIVYMGSDSSEEWQLVEPCSTSAA